MAEEDMQLGAYLVDRLTAVKAVLGDFLDRRVGDRVGLLVFGQRAYAVTPLTLDRNSVRAQLDDSVVGLAGQETAIGDAIGLAVKRLRDEAASSGAPEPAAEAAGGRTRKVVILLTDGVNTAGAIAPDKAAELAEQAGVRVHTIGFGAEPRELGFFGRLSTGPSIDERTLRAIAERTGGRYFRARDTNELAGIYAELDRIEPAAVQGEVQRPRIERYALPLAAALVVAALALLMRQLPRVAR
jgi:Ca-activated chloride channel family protein